MCLFPSGNATHSSFYQDNFHHSMSIVCAEGWNHLCQLHSWNQGTPSKEDEGVNSNQVPLCLWIFLKTNYTGKLLQPQVLTWRSIKKLLIQTTLRYLLFVSSIPTLLWHQGDTILVSLFLKDLPKSTCEHPSTLYPSTYLPLLYQKWIAVTI
jgi:hypothetical protein